MHALHEEVSALVERGKRSGAPFNGRWSQPKQGPWVSVSINGKYPGRSGKKFGGTFPLNIDKQIEVIKGGHKEWLAWAHERWGHEPFTIAAFMHPKQGGQRSVLWYWDSSDGFRDTTISRNILKKARGKFTIEDLNENGDMIQHVVDMAKKHGVKGEGPGGKLTPAQVRKLADMREDLDDEVDQLAEGKPEDDKPAKVSNIKVGTKLRLMRRPIYARTAAPSERMSIKVVAEIDVDGKMMLRFKKTYYPGHKPMLNYFQAHVQDGVLVSVSSGPPKPLRYEVHGIV